MPSKLRTQSLQLALCAACLSGLAYSSAASADTIKFSSKTTGFQTVNTRQAGSVEFAQIDFFGANGMLDPTTPVTVGTSNPSLLQVIPVSGNPLGNYQLSVPANAPAGSVTVTARSTLAGVLTTRSRDFTVLAAAQVPVVTTPGLSTMQRASKPTLAADQSGCASITYYDVGPGHTYPSLGKLPWSRLQGCDTVRIYAKPNNAPYYEMMLLSAGTNLTPTAPTRFMRVIGMPDPVTGALPIIDGTNATQLETLPGQAPRSLQYHDNANPNRALYKLGLVMVGPQAGYNYSFGPTGYIGIENLDIRNSVYAAPFIDGSTGGAGSYSSFGSCLYVEASAHLVVKNNSLHNCGNGLFINSKNSTPVELSQDVLIEANRFYNNSNAPLAGVTNGFSEHNSYTEARDIIFQYNHFGDVRPGAFGDCLKDRSSGLVVRYNTFASTCGILLNLQDSTGGQSLIWGDAGYSATHVYGNLFDITPAAAQSTNLVFYGGDSGTVAHYRQGTLLFYNNTMRVKGDAGHGIYPETLMFNLVLPGAVADVRNNVFYASPSTAGAPGKVQAMAIGKGTVNMRNNWVSPNASPFWAGHLVGGVVNGWNTNIGANNQPNLANETQHDFSPAAASPLINQGNSLSDLATGWLPVGQPGTAPVRKQDNMLDIGAFEF